MNPDGIGRDENDNRPIQRVQTPRQMYKFSPDETRVMKECNRESFWRRCVPLGTALGVATYVGVNTGHLKRHPKYGPTPKVVLSVIIGYFVGKFSYQGKCAEKLMQLPNSPIGEMLRQRRKGYLRETYDALDPSFGPGMSLAPFSTPTEAYTDLVPANDVGTNPPQYEGLDDSHRPSVDDSLIYEEEMPPVQRHTTTYDELRKKNREDYQQKRIGVYRSSEGKASQPSMSQGSQAPAETGPPPVATNKYGDSWT